MNTSAKTTQKTDTADYQTLQLELDEVLSSLQSGELSIDQAIAAYERGQIIVAELEKYLKQAENKIKKLS